VPGVTTVAGTYLIRGLSQLEFGLDAVSNIHVFDGDAL